MRVPQDLDMIEERIDRAVYIGSRELAFNGSGYGLPDIGRSDRTVVMVESDDSVTMVGRGSFVTANDSFISAWTNHLVKSDRLICNDVDRFNSAVEAGSERAVVMIENENTNQRSDPAVMIGCSGHNVEENRIELRRECEHRICNAENVQRDQDVLSARNNHTISNIQALLAEKSDQNVVTIAKGHFVSSRCECVALRDEICANASRQRTNNTVMLIAGSDQAIVQNCCTKLRKESDEDLASITGGGRPVIPIAGTDQSVPTAESTQPVGSMAGSDQTVSIVKSGQLSFDHAVLEVDDQSIVPKSFNVDSGSHHTVPVEKSAHTVLRVESNQPVISISGHTEGDHTIFKVDNNYSAISTAQSDQVVPQPSRALSRAESEYFARLQAGGQPFALPTRNYIALRADSDQAVVPVSRSTHTVASGPIVLKAESDQTVIRGESDQAVVPSSRSFRTVPTEQTMHAVLAMESDRVVVPRSRSVRTVPIEEIVHSALAAAESLPPASSTRHRTLLREESDRTKVENDHEIAAHISRPGLIEENVNSVSRVEINQPVISVSGSDHTALSIAESVPPGSQNDRSVAIDERALAAASSHLRNVSVNNSSNVHLGHRFVSVTQNMDNSTNTVKTPAFFLRDHGWCINMWKAAALSVTISATVVIVRGAVLVLKSQ